MGKCQTSAFALALLLFSLFPSSSAQPCQCKELWSEEGDELTENPKCHDQEGCEARACDGDRRPWCQVENPGCDEESKADGGGWAYCSPIKHERPQCVCEDQWSLEGKELEQDPKCTNQHGCEAHACDGDSRPWCLVSNPGCWEEEEDDGGEWMYCTPHVRSVDHGHFEANDVHRVGKPQGRTSKVSPHKGIHDREWYVDGLWGAKHGTVQDGEITEQPQHANDIHQPKMGNGGEENATSTEQKMLNTRGAAAAMQVRSKLRSHRR